MCDPLSVTSSVLAVATVVAQTCDALCTLFQSYHDTTGYLKHCILMLEAWRAVFAGIAKLHTKSSDHMSFDPGLKSRLVECGHYLRAIENIVTLSHDKVHGCRADRVWTKMKWSTAHQRRKIDKFMARLESHCTTFIMTLSLMNIQVGSQSNSNLSDLKHPSISKLILFRKRRQVLARARDIDNSTQWLATANLKAGTQGEIGARSRYRQSGERWSIKCAPSVSSQNAQQSSKEDKAVTSGISCEGSDPNGPLAFGSKPERCLTNPTIPFRDNLSLRIDYAKKIKRRIMPLLCWAGHIARREPSGKEISSFTMTRSHSGYAIGFAITTYWCLALRLEGVFYIFLRPRSFSVSISSDCVLRFPNVVSWDSEVVALSMSGDVEGMKTKFQSGEASPFDVLPNGSTLLHLAAMRDRLGMVEFLVQQGALLNAIDDFGDTPLHRSLEMTKDYNLPRILIENGAELCNRNIDGETPVHTHFGPVLEQIFLTQSGLLDLSICDKRGKTLLHHLAWSSRTSLRTFRDASMRSGSINRILDQEQRSVLHYAAQRGNVALVQYMLEQLDLNINQKDVSGRTPLHHAIESSRAGATIKLLVSKGADVAAKDDQGWSAMHLAARRNKESAVQSFRDLQLSSKEFFSPIGRDNEIQNVLPLAFQKDMQATSEHLSASHGMSTMKLNGDCPSGSIKKKQACYMMLLSFLFGLTMLRVLPAKMEVITAKLWD